LVFLSDIDGGPVEVEFPSRSFCTGGVRWRLGIPVGR
jgi:hypothetical protein